jgi:hypothetical protein
VRLFIFTFAFLLVLFGRSEASGQQYADTIPSNKNAILEEFTAVHCFFCPAGHALLDSLITENPGRVFGVAMHAANTSYTAPYAGSPDFRRSFIDAFFSVPFATDSLKFFPGAFINRRLWQPGRREQYTSHWREFTDTILNEPSPVNIGLHTIYNYGSNELTMEVEIYYTDTLLSPHNLYVFLTEDSLVAEQNNGGTDYIHNHIFRESLTAQWGDTVISSGMQGCLYTHTYSFDNSLMQYNIQNCHVLAMIRDATNEEIINGTCVPVQDFTTNTDSYPNKKTVTVYPNPFIDKITVGPFNDMQTLNGYSVYDMAGRFLFGNNEIYVTPQQTIQIEFPAGITGNIFILEIISGPDIIHIPLLRL